MPPWNPCDYGKLPAIASQDLSPRGQAAPGTAPQPVRHPDHSYGDERFAELPPAPRRQVSFDSKKMRDDLDSMGEFSKAQKRKRINTGRTQKGLDEAKQLGVDDWSVRENPLPSGDNVRDYTDEELWPEADAASTSSAAPVTLADQGPMQPTGGASLPPQPSTGKPWNRETAAQRIVEDERVIAADYDFAHREAARLGTTWAQLNDKNLTPENERSLNAIKDGIRARIKHRSAGHSTHTTAKEILRKGRASEGKPWSSQMTVFDPFDSSEW